nr:hypothetical protein [Planctomycetota bacterium]
MLPLGYSSNLHAAETVAEIIERVVPFASAVRERLGWSRMGVDLRLGMAALDGTGLTDLRRALDRGGLSAHTLNGFPLRPFQQPRVKEQAYLPDWTDPERETATMALLDAALALSDEPEVTISTVPGSYRPFGAARNDARAIAAALGRWAAAAATVHRDRGRTAILCLEPEPWCLLETSWDVAAFWTGPLAEHGVAAATAALGSERDGRAAIARHLGVCFDTCHISLAFEDQRAAADRMAASGARIAKCQLSAAPEVRLPHRDAQGLSQL